MKAVIPFITGAIFALTGCLATIGHSDNQFSSHKRLPPGFDNTEHAYEVATVWYDPKREILRVNVTHSPDWNYELSFWGDVFTAITDRLIFFYHTNLQEQSPNDVVSEVRANWERSSADMLSRKYK